MMGDAMDDLRAQVSACRICANRFAATKTAHEPRPIVWFRKQPRILIAGQAPGMRVFQSGVPFDDPSGDRLRDWLGLERATFYDQSKVAIVPMGFCFPGYDAKGSDLPPPPICARTWRARVLETLGKPRLTVLVGGYAHKYHLGTSTSVSETVRHWRDHLAVGLPLPHPSWRNTGWLRKNPWFQTDLLPDLRTRVKEALND